MMKQAKRFNTKALIASDRTAMVLNDQVRQGLVTGEGSIEVIQLSSIAPSRHNPRSLPITDQLIANIQANEAIDHSLEAIVDDLTSLAESIKTNGLLQPIVVTSVGNGRYEVVAGERRYWACKILGKEVVRAIVRQVEEKQHIALALTENLARTDLTLLEKVDALRELVEIDNKYARAEEVQAVIGVSRRASFQLIKAVFDDAIYEAIKQGKIKSMREIDEFTKVDQKNEVATEKPAPAFIRWQIAPSVKDELLELARIHKPELYDQLVAKK